MGILRRKFNKIFNRVKSREQKTKKSRKTSESSSATEGSTAYCISDAKLEKNYSKIGADQSKKIADVEYTVNFQLDRSPNNGYGKTQDEQSAIVLREIGQFGAKNQATSEGRLYDLDITLDECATDSSGYLSGDHLSKYHISLNASPALSPASLKYRTLSNGDWKQPEITVESTPELLSIYIPRYRQSTCPDLNIISRFKKHILETKYVTSIFELSNNGIRNLIGDVSTELDYFFKDFDLLGLACEIHWSIPERYRERNAERRLKDVLHVSLRENNRIILNLKERIGIDLPLSMLSAITEENCIRNHALESYQGIYRRYYAALLPLQHSETAVVHQDYWTLSDIQYSQKDPPQPNIGQFLYGHDAVKLDRGSLIALNIIGLKLARLRIVAQSVLVPEMTSTRLLRIRINDMDDNSPCFPNSDYPFPQVFIVDRTKLNSFDTIFIGNIKAIDFDGPLYNSIYYYLLPLCSNMDSAFTIDKTSGTISMDASFRYTDDEYTLCGVASPFDKVDYQNITYDAKNMSMVKFVVELRPKSVPNFKLGDRLLNSTIVIYGADNSPLVPISFDKMNSGINYYLDSVSFTPSESASGLAGPIDSYFSVDESTGDVRIDPLLFANQEGVFHLKIGVEKNVSTDINQDYVFTKVHNVKKSSTMKFVFNEEANNLGMNIAEFGRNLKDVLDSEPSSADVSIFLSSPRAYKSSVTNRSSVCFHFTRTDVILNQGTIEFMLPVASNDETALTRLFQAYKLVNIEPCFTEHESISSEFIMSHPSLFWIGFSLLGILFLFLACVYAFFASQYHQYLDNKSVKAFGAASRIGESHREKPSLAIHGRHLCIEPRQLLGYDG